MTKRKMKTKSYPKRRCIGCSQTFDQHTLFRISMCNGELKFDKTGKANGRGVYLCKNPQCLDDAMKRKAFNRGFKTNFNKELLEELSETITKELNDQK